MKGIKKDVQAMSFDMTDRDGGNEVFDTHSFSNKESNFR